jgi:uncharacterized protein (TIGR03067 family)
VAFDDVVGTYFNTGSRVMSCRSMVVFCAFVLVAVAGPRTAADEKEDAKKELEKLQGTWTFDSREEEGKAVPAEKLKGYTLIFKGDKFMVKQGDKVFQAGTEKLGPTRKPKTVDAKVTEGFAKGTVMLGIYEIDGDTLKVCFDPEGKKRPTEFKTAPGSGTFINVHKRVKK